MKRILLALAIAAAIVTPAAAAPKADSRTQCVILSNLAMVAGTLGKNGIAATKALRISQELYGGLYDERADAHDLVVAVIGAAYRHLKTKEPPVAFSIKLLETCMQNEGDMDSILGKPV